MAITLAQVGTPDDIAVIADIHLGRPIGPPGAEFGPGLKWATAAVTTAAQTCSHLVVLGDVIDKRHFSAQTFKDVRDFFAHAVASCESVLFVPGNHDAHHTLDLPTEVLVAPEHPATYFLGGWAIHTVAVATDPDPRHVVGDFPTRVADKPNVGLLHTSGTGALSRGLCLPTTADELTACNYDAWVLGHVHTPTVHSCDPFIGWVGMGELVRLTRF